MHTNQRPRVRTALAWTALVLVATTGARADDFFWQAPVSGQYSTPGNWLPSGPPEAGDTAIFDLDSSGYTVMIANPTDVRRIQIDNDTLTLSGSSLSTDEASQAAIELGRDAGNVAHLTLAPGMSLEGPVIVLGSVAGAQATVVVGPNAALRETGAAQGSMVVGAGGSGTLDINGGGTTTLENSIVVGADADSHGSVLIDGTGSLLTAFQHNQVSVIVGQSGMGEVSITNGGALANEGINLVIGDLAGSQGTVSVDGSTSQISAHGTPDSIVVGRNGTGVLNVTGGAMVDADAVHVGVYLEFPPTGGTGDGTLMLDGSTLVTSGALQSVVGYQSQGTVELTNGATWNGNEVSIGFQGGEGFVSVSNSTWTADEIDLGNSGKLSVSNGALVAQPSGMLDNDGTIEIEAATLQARVDNSATIDNNGTLDGDVFNTGIIEGNGIITGTLQQQGGMVAPGNSTGTLQVGSLIHISGSYQIELNSALGSAGGAIGWDLIECLDLAQLSGTATFEIASLTPTNEPGLLSDFDPDHNYQWTILTADDLRLFGSVALDTSQFANSYSGQFFISESGDTLVLKYRVPEPSSGVLAVLGLAPLWFGRRLWRVRLRRVDDRIWSRF